MAKGSGEVAKFGLDFFQIYQKMEKNGQVLTKLANWPMEKVTGQMVFQLARFELFGHKLAHLAALPRWGSNHTYAKGGVLAR